MSFVHVDIIWGEDLGREHPPEMRATSIGLLWRRPYPKSSINKTFEKLFNQKIFDKVFYGKYLPQGLPPSPRSSMKKTFEKSLMQKTFDKVFYVKFLPKPLL